MIKHVDISSQELYRNIKNKAFLLAGNTKLKIYGTLDCKSGKRLMVENRVFFKNEVQAIKEGFRPCGHCLKTTYKIWKIGLV